MNLRRLRYFIAVAEELNFSRAAVRLHISQPPLSQQIQLLESDLGVVLFDRNRRNVRLTHAGQVFLGHARAIVEQYETATRLCAMAHAGKVGTVRLAFTASVPLFEDFARLLREFRNSYPGIRVTLNHLSTGDQLLALGKHQIDVGFLRPSPLFVGQPSLELRQLWQDVLCVALPISHTLAKKQPKKLHLETLAQEPFVIQPSTMGSGLSEHIASLTSQAGFTPHVAQEASETPTALALVAAGLGIAIVPSVYANITPPGVMLKPLDGDNARSRILMATEIKPRDSCVQSFLDFADANISISTV